MPTRTRPPEIVQRVADAYIDLAQRLERHARMLRDHARHYRAGELDAAYNNLPDNAGPHMRHPAQRAIDCLNGHKYAVVTLYDTITAELQAKP